MASEENVSHCPTCQAEYDAGVSICPDDGTMLVSGPSPSYEPEREQGRGTITVIRRPPEDVAPQEHQDLFEHEEHPSRVVLAIMAREDAPGLIEALEAEGIGARLGEPTPEEGLEVVVHDVHLADAQAVLVDFTGDPSLVDDVDFDTEDDEAGTDAEPESDGFVTVSTGRAAEIGAQADRLAAKGIDVRMEVPDLADAGKPGITAALWVDREDVEEARATLGIKR